MGGHSFFQVMRTICVVISLIISARGLFHVCSPNIWEIQARSQRFTKHGFCTSCVPWGLWDGEESVRENGLTLASVYPIVLEEESYVSRAFRGSERSWQYSWPAVAYSWVWGQVEKRGPLGAGTTKILSSQRIYSELSPSGFWCSTGAMPHRRALATLWSRYFLTMSPTGHRRHKS